VSVLYPSAMRRFELIDGSSRKFWEVTLDNNTLTVRFGRIGTDGQTKGNVLASPAAARAEHGKLVAEKTKKGYREVPAGSAPKPAQAPAGVQGQLAKLSALWAEKRPGFEKRMRPGAKATTLAKFLKKLGLKVPPEFLAFYAWHDGAKDHAIDRLETDGWLSLAGILEFKKMLDTMGFEDEDTYPKYAWSRAWIPFLESDGDSDCIDARSGVVFKRYNNTQVVLLAPSFAAWLSAHVAITEATRVVSGEDADDTFFAAFNGAIEKRVRGKISPGYPKRPPNAKSLC
jgi:predicted DNA-binding WGR domain protein/cell wall assembly regulator SMI1